jgi:hypothetical protein
MQACDIVVPNEIVQGIALNLSAAIVGRSEVDSMDVIQKKVIAPILARRLVNLVTPARLLQEICHHGVLLKWGLRAWAKG